MSQIDPKTHRDVSGLQLDKMESRELLDRGYDSMSSGKIITLES